MIARLAVKIRMWLQQSLGTRNSPASKLCAQRVNRRFDRRWDIGSIDNRTASSGVIEEAPTATGYGYPLLAVDNFI
jgi:hypothetical protein